MQSIFHGIFEKILLSNIVDCLDDLYVSVSVLICLYVSVCVGLLFMSYERKVSFICPAASGDC